MSKKLNTKHDPLIQFRVSDHEHRLLSKLAELDTRTLPNFVKAIVLREITDEKIIQD